MSVMIATSPTTCSTRPRAMGTTRGLTLNTPSVEPMSPPSMAPRPIDVQITTFCRDSPRSMSTSRSAAIEASMNHASSGPLSSARNTPWSADTMARSHTVSATSSRLMAAIENRVARIRTGLRPRASASPPLGSSRNSMTTPCAAVPSPICARDRPRSSISSTNTVTKSPVGTNRRDSSR